MGTVFKARHKRLNRIVALKVLKPSLARDKRYVERLRREARIVASLSHAHIVAGYDLGEEGGYHFFVMEFVEGKSLRQLLNEWGMFSEGYVLRVARETALALDHAYQRDVIHRDIKPGNILIDEVGKVKLTDMGLAKGPADLALTRDGATVGTPMYISPEQARNPQDVDVRSDLYSLGATLYHMATGVPPFSGDTMAALITNVLNENVVPPDEANSAVSLGMSLVIRKLLAKNLTVRYQTPRELLDDLDLIEKSQQPAVDAGRLEARNHESSRWARIVLVGLSMVLMVGGALWIGQQMRDPSAAVPSAKEYLAKLDLEMAGLEASGERYLHLLVVVPPEGGAQEVEARKRRVAMEIQRDLDSVIDQLNLTKIASNDGWLHDERIWPSLAAFERERLGPQIRERTGIWLDQMPSSVSLSRVEQLLEAVADIIRQRDDELLVRFEQFLTTQLPGRANERMRASDFAGADALWRDAARTFCNGADQPFPERLAKPVRTAMDQMLSKAKAAALEVLRLEEQKVIGALRQEVSDTVALFRARLQQQQGNIALDRVDPSIIWEALQRFRSSLGDHWPPSDNFRLGTDPWEFVEQQLMTGEHAVELAMKELQGRRFDARCDLAWRVYCNGDARAALSILRDMEPATEAQEEELNGHRRCLEATYQVEQALLLAISEQRLVAFRAEGTAIPYALSVKAQGGVLQLVGQAGIEASIALRLTELRIGDLLGTAKLGAENAGPVKQLATGVQSLGLSVLRLAADRTKGFESHIGQLHPSDRNLLLDHVWPRINRARGVSSNQPIDQQALFDALSRSLESLEQGGSLSDLEGALSAVNYIASEQRTAKQSRLLVQAKKSYNLYLRERNKQKDLGGLAPRDALVDVQVKNGELISTVILPTSVLRAGAGWQAVGEDLEFAGGGGLWINQGSRSLRGRPGHTARSEHSRLELELKFPAADPRWYIVEFDGVTVMIVIAANNSVQVELMEGPALDEKKARQSFEKALQGQFGPPIAYVIPESLHRLSIDVVPTSAQTQANIIVKFENKELIRRLFKCDTKRAPDFVIHPMQELKVTRASVQVWSK